jgi:4,5-dihydroxyphthalate decarboxylase
MPRLPITLATYGYDHVRDLVDGRVSVEGLEVTGLVLQFEDIVHRMELFGEFDVAEFSTGKYVSMLSRGDDRFVGLPVFPSRVPRLSAIYVNPEGPVRRAEDLRGRRVGVPEWAQTATIYLRGWLTDAVGVRLADVDWYQGGVNDPGRREEARIDLPAGVRLTPVADRTLSELLLARELDAVFSARPPAHFLAGKPGMARLFPDYREAEEAYCRKSGIVPIMHTFVVKRTLVERHPWILRSLYDGFERAKRASVERALDITASRFPILWAYDHAAASRAVFGGDPWPYGVEANRVTLDAFLRWAFEQGVAARRLAPEEMFPASLQSGFKV